MSFTVKPGRNATLAHAWDALYGKPSKASKAKAKPEVEPPAKVTAKKPTKTNAKPSRAKGGKTTKRKP